MNGFDLAAFLAYELRELSVRPHYYCRRCKALFDEPATWHYREDMNGEGAWQTFYVPICPQCGNEDYEELEEPDDDIVV